jgi:hypothetical protein
MNQAHQVSSALLQASRCICAGVLRTTKGMRAAPYVVRKDLDCSCLYHPTRSYRRYIGFYRWLIIDGRCRGDYQSKVTGLSGARIFYLHKRNGLNIPEPPSSCECKLHCILFNYWSFWHCYWAFSLSHPHIPLLSSPCRSWVSQIVSKLHRLLWN